MNDLKSAEDVKNKCENFTDEVPEENDGDFSFVCPRCNELNPLKGDPLNFRNKPFKCLGCGYVPLLDAEAINDFVEAQDNGTE